MTTKNATVDVETGSPRGFAVVIQEVNDGQLHAELSEEMQRLAKVLFNHALDNGKGKGVLTLKLAMTVDHMGVTTIAPEVTVKEPKPLRGNAVFWLDKANNLVNKNPKQLDLAIRDVSMKNQPPRDVGAGKNDAKSV